MMMKKAICCITVSIFACVVSLSAQDVEIFMDHPDQVRAGEAFEVTVTIQKGSLSDYSRFSQDLPLGLTAANVSSPNADFSFDNQRIRIIWLKLPEGDDVEVTYQIHVNERLKGSFMLGGVFAYVVEDERKFLNYEQTDEITIIPSSTIDPGLIVDIRNFGSGEETPGEEAAAEEYAMAIRQKPVLLGSGGYLVNLLIDKPEGSQYAKIEETIPSGYTFEEVDSHGGIVSFAASTVKFIWMKLPEESEFVVSYRLVPVTGEPQKDMVIEGLLTYRESGENKVVEVKQRDVVLAELSPDQQRTLLQTGEMPEGASRTEPLAEAGSPGQTPGRTGSATPPEGRDRQEGISATSGRSTSGTYFRVQLSANSRPIDAESHFGNAGIDKEIFMEQHEGLYKYTAGTFRTYEAAAGYRNRIERLPGITGSFVVAYRDGRRIPVDAAMR